MDFDISHIKEIISSIGIEEYLIFAGVIFFLIYIYTLRKEKKELQKSIDNNIKIFKKACDVADDAMLILSNNNTIIYANKSLSTLFELDKEFELKSVENLPQIKVKKEWINLDTFLKEEQLNIAKKRLSFSQVMLRVGRHQQIPINLYCDTLLINKQIDERYYIITIKNLTESQKSLKMLYRHKLTNLPNQNQALQDLPSFFSKTHLEKNKIALVLMDFDNFSRLRAIIGYEQANEVIIKFSKYLIGIMSEMNISVYHTFDNHFLLTISSVESIESVKNLVGEIQKKLTVFYQMDEANLHLTVSAGIAVYPDSGSTRTLLDNTYKALSQAQHEGYGKVMVYIPEVKQNAYDELSLHNSMQKSLENGDFEVYYQPIVDAKTQEVVSAEALIRWIHPKYGFISPDNFIYLMEKTGFIIKLGQYILEEVLKQQKRWELFKFKQITVSINVSMVEISTGNFVENVQKQLQHHQVHPERIKFEITEGMAMIGETDTEKYFHTLKKLGVGISLDDFGTGYTSFTYLKKFPADILKIDKSLVDNILKDKEDQRIVKAMIDLGHNIGMKIVVEGIETKAMVDLLVSYDCDYIQGYYFSKPLPVFEFQKLLR